MERLTYKITNIQTGDVLSYGLNSGCNMMLKSIQKLGAYEDAEEQGLLLKLPCAIGSKVYFIYKYGKPIREYIVDSYSTLNNYLFIHLKRDLGTLCIAEKEIGKTAFLTKEEAEQALKQMGERICEE